MAELLVVGHGSNSDSPSRQTLLDHCAQAESMLAGVRVRGAYLRGEPNLEAVVPHLQADSVTLVPALMADGYVTNQLLPETLDRVLEECNATDLKVRLSRPIGTHESMTAAIRNRIRNASSGCEPEAQGLAIVGHGSTRNPESGKAVRQHAERIRASGPFDEVEALFLEGKPSIDALDRRFSCEHVLIVPFFFERATHVRVDIPTAVGLPPDTKAVRNTWRRVGNKRVTLTERVGSAPHVARVIASRALEAGLDPAVRGDPTRE